MIIKDIESTKLKPWSPDARSTIKDIETATKSARSKIEKFGNIKCELPPFYEGDENEFLTKES